MIPLLLVLLTASAPATPQRGSDSAGFVTTLGRDTIALENVRRSGRRIDGEIVLRVPGTVALRYVLDLREDGSVSRSFVEQRPVAAAGVAPRRVTIDFLPDSIRVTTDSAGTRESVVRPATRGTTPVLTTGFGSSYGLYAAIGMYGAMLARLPQRVNDSTPLPVVGALNGRTGSRQMVRRSPALVDVDYFGIAWTHLALDARGEIESVNASETTEKTMTRRAAPLDIAAAVKDFAARDRQGESIGVASPPDSARATIGGATVSVRYSSPRLRGRTLLGVTIPYDAVWRTGANAATELATDHELAIGGTRIPAGTYTLWTIPGRLGTELIINSQHGQWGTAYDSSHDVAHMMMQLATATEPREHFTIELTPSATDGALRILWGPFVWSVSVSAR